jgi:hypothetical protein
LGGAWLANVWQRYTRTLRATPILARADAGWEIESLRRAWFLQTRRAARLTAAPGASTPWLASSVPYLSRPSSRYAAKHPGPGPIQTRRTRSSRHSTRCAPRQTRFLMAIAPGCPRSRSSVSANTAGNQPVSQIRGG